MSEAGQEANKVYTISMSTVIKMECDDCSKSEHIEKGTKHNDVKSVRNVKQYALIAHY